MKTFLLVAISIGLAAARLLGHKSIPFQAIAHCWDAGLVSLGLWGNRSNSRQLFWIGWLLGGVEVFKATLDHGNVLLAVLFAGMFWLVGGVIDLCKFP